MSNYIGENATRPVATHTALLIVEPLADVLRNDHRHFGQSFDMRQMTYPGKPVHPHSASQTISMPNR
jgi:hypothetical protein